MVIMRIRGGADLTDRHKAYLADFHGGIENLANDRHHLPDFVTGA